MIRKWQDRRRPLYYVWQARQLARNIHHFVEKLFIFLSDSDIASEVDDETTMVSGVFIQ